MRTSVGAEIGNCFTTAQHAETGSHQGKYRKRLWPQRRTLGPELGCLRSTFTNFTPKQKTLLSRWIRGNYEVRSPSRKAAPTDVRGPVVREVETAQTFLTESEIDRLMEDYLAGISVNQLAQQYGVHRATIARHLRRRNVAVRTKGLDEAEQADAVRLFRGGVSIRAISNRMGVGRKAIRTALVDAGLTEQDLRQSKARRKVAA